MLGAQREQELPLPCGEAVCTRPGACCRRPPSLQPSPCVRTCLFLHHRLFFFFLSLSPSTWGYDAVSLGPRVVPGPLASLMLIGRRRGGGRGRGASGQGSSFKMRSGWKQGEGASWQVLDKPLGMGEQWEEPALCSP